jgi:hypothetical protein
MIKVLNIPHEIGVIVGRIYTDTLSYPCLTFFSHLPIILVYLFISSFYKSLFVLANAFLGFMFLTFDFSTVRLHWCKSHYKAGRAHIGMSQVSCCNLLLRLLDITVNFRTSSTSFMLGFVLEPTQVTFSSSLFSVAGFLENSAREAAGWSDGDAKFEERTDSVEVYV